MSPFPGLLLAGRYRLDAHIATGGMGEVWRATDTTLRRVVAVKILSPGFAEDAAFRKRFAAEARTVAALQAPGVVAIYDAVETVAEDGRPLAFLVMEYVPGESLATLLHGQGRLRPERAMSIVAQAADALDAAHRAGIVHRDVKPGNIIVRPGGDVTIVDFGVAKARGEAALTTAGNILATIRYAAPEQLAGKELGPAADVYALGVVAYECLTGDVPFAGESTAAVVAGHLQQPPPSLPPEIPAGMAAVVHRALAKDPARRYASAAEFAAACRGDAAPLTATRALPAGTATRVMPRTAHDTLVATAATPFRYRRPAVIAATAAAAAILIAALLVWGSGDDTEGPGTAAEPSTQTGADTEEAPRVPTDSRLAAASTGDCLNATEEVKQVHLAGCGSAATITFSAAENTYLLGLHDGKEQRCLAPSGNMEKIELKGCDDAETWTVEWLGAADGRNRWRLASTAHPGRCLSASGETFEEGKDKGKGKGKDKGEDKAVYRGVTLADCATGDDQVWLTAA